jgi:hypothetical protein
MASKLVAQNMALLTANGTTQGMLTVADTSLFPAGCFVFLIGNTVPSVKCKVIKVLSATTLTVRIVPSPEELNSPLYGWLSDVSTYTTADSAKLYIEHQAYDEYASTHLL